MRNAIPLTTKVTSVLALIMTVLYRDISGKMLSAAEAGPMFIHHVQIDDAAQTITLTMVEQE